MSRTTNLEELGESHAAVIAVTRCLCAAVEVEADEEEVDAGEGGGSWCFEDIQTGA